MSSPEETTAPSFKKRKLQRACDYCRTKKIKCDGSDMPNNRCSKCISRRMECTYLLGQNNNYPRSYVEDLESRLERMERLMNKLLPDKDIEKELDDHASDRDLSNALTPASERSHASSSRVEIPRTPSSLSVVPPTPPSAADVSQDAQSDEEEEEATELDKELAEGMRKLSMHSPPQRYHGKSSGLVFIRSAMALKNEVAPEYPPPPSRDGQHSWLKNFVENDFPVLPSSAFPPPDLLSTLVDLFFAHMNSHYPVLHQPTFTASIAAGEHLRNGGFGATVLLVCAIGARFTRPEQEPRVLLDGEAHYHSAGWRWFLAVAGMRKMSFAPAKIYDLQIYALMALFLQGSTAPQSTWPVIGAGIRMALDVGAHRKKMYSPRPTVDEELWRRSFWLLVLMEWMIGYGLGRPSSIHDEDFDIGLPTECDDEYWLTPEGEPLFQQPPGKPSKVTAFVCMLRMCQILAFAMRTIYATNKSRAQLGHADQQWEQRIVADLDSALNKWSDSLPAHLRWNPEEENVMFLTQAGTLSASYYYTQFAVHRSFMAAGRRDAPMSFPSVIICTNGARTSIQILETLYKRTGTPNHRNMGILLVSGVVLMTNIFALKRSGRAVNAGKDLILVRKAIEMLRSLRYEVHVAESLGEMLNELVSAVKDPRAAPQRTPISAASSPAAQPTEGPSTSQQLTAGDVSSAHAAPAQSTTSSQAGETPDMPPGLEFMDPNHPLFGLAFGPDGIGPFSQDFAGAGPSTFAAPGAGNQQPSLSLSAPEHEYGFLHPHDPPASQPRASASQGVGVGMGMQGETQFDMSGGQMFGLEPFGYNESMSMSMSFLPPGTTGPEFSQAQQQHTNAFGDSDPGAMGPGDHVDTDFVLMDDALTVWENLPPAVGWEEWGAYFADTSNAGT
ncbi:transcription factor [Ganoderma sinense ZZ0214-1]|uniref:Transcription factor n=1 Tax=Ganoderma sinense ZZ0214-1 TaxID=1077348 RepID=A0A2G8RVA3_9APHY|nr:transcription factor [Ganoderma sinense ZZ0214-1]